MPAGLVAPATPELLGPADLAMLARLDLVHRRRRRGVYPGERRSPRSARSPEFADFRPYAQGDDFRQIDWRAFARHERLMLRLSVADEESALNVVIDASDSMSLGDPAKWPVAQHLAAAVAMLGLTGMDRVAVGVLRPGGQFSPHVRGRAGASRLMAFVAGLATGGTAAPTDLGGLRWMRPGLTVVISDFLVEGSWAPALAALQSARQEPLLWQVLAPDEESPVITGDLRLYEAETARHRDLTINARLVQSYLTALAGHREGLRRQAAWAAGTFLHSRSDCGLEGAMLAGIAAGAIRRA